MSEEQVKISTTARNYAQALIEVAQSDKLPYDILANDLEIVSEVFTSSKDLVAAIKNPAIDINIKTDIISSVFGGKISNEVINFLKILVEKNRFLEFNQIYAEFKNMYYSAQNIQPVTVVSAIDLSDSQKQRIVNKLTEKLKKTVITEWKTDTDIIAGITVKIDDNVIDMSLKNRIEKLGKSLMLK